MERMKIMNKDGLRPCVVKFVNFGSEKWVEVHNAFFHKWYEREIGALKELMAVVEYEDGSMRFVRPGAITFTDRNSAKVNIDYDAIGKLTAKIMKESCTISVKSL